MNRIIMSNYTNNWQIASVGGGSGLNLQAASQNTISLTSTSGLAGLEADWITTYNPNVKKYQIMETVEDLLALSTTWKRLRDERKISNHNGYIVPTSLIDNILFSNITDIDRSRAGEVRDYYSKKVVYWKLKDIPLSRFRQEMSEFIHTDGKRFKEEILPLVYRLPEFYEYDTQFEEMAREHNQSFKDTTGYVGTKTLNLVKTFNVNKKHSKRKEYWFADNNDNLVMIPVDSSNPLASLLDLVSKNPICIDGKFRHRTTDYTQYLMGDKFTFI